MPTSRALQGVIAGFLGTFGSRNSDYDGYWLFGLVVNDLDEESIDLLGSATSPRGAKPGQFMQRLAKVKFRDQLYKAGFTPDFLSEAALELRRSTDPREGCIDGSSVRGFVVTLTVIAKASSGPSFANEATLLVAPHSTRLDRRSVRRLPLRARVPGWAGT